jgi:uncharacterized membrane protein
VKGKVQVCGGWSVARSSKVKGVAWKSRKRARHERGVRNIKSSRGLIRAVLNGRRRSCWTNVVQPLVRYVNAVVDNLWKGKSSIFNR